MSKTDTDISNIEIPKDAKQMSKELRETVTQGVKDGTLEHKQIAQGIKNLIPLNQRTKEERTEIARKGALALKEIRGEKKNAKQILDDLLPLYAKDSAIDSNDTIPQDIKELIKAKNIKITQYDLIMLSQIYQAQNGNVKSAEFIANHFGDIVQKDIKVTESMSEADKKLIEKLSNRLNIVDVD